MAESMTFGAPDIQGGDSVSFTDKGIVIHRNTPFISNQIYVRFHGLNHYVEWTERNSQFLPEKFVELVRQLGIELRKDVNP